MSLEEKWPAPTVEQMGYTWEQIASMAKLGLVLEGLGVDGVDASDDCAISFSFVPDSPMGRANSLAGTEDYEMLGTCIQDARDLPYTQFVEKYPSLAPFAE